MTVSAQPPRQLIRNNGPHAVAEERKRSTQMWQYLLRRAFRPRSDIDSIGGSPNRDSRPGSRTATIATFGSASRQPRYTIVPPPA